MWFMKFLSLIRLALPASGPARVKLQENRRKNSPFLKAKEGTFVQKVHGSGVDSSGRRQNAVALGLFQWLCHPGQKVPGRGATCHHRW